MSGVRLTKVGIGDEVDTSVLVNPARFLWAEDRPRQTRNGVGFPGPAGRATTAQGQRMTLLIFAGTASTLSVTESVDEVERAIFGGQVPKAGVKETRVNA